MTQRSGASTDPARPSVRRLVEAYDSAAKSAMTVASVHVDDPSIMLPIADALPPEAAGLLGSLFLSVPPGERLPRRLVGAIERLGGPLWASALLLPDTNATDVHPRHYGGSCRLNPVLKGWVPAWLQLPEIEVNPTFPPADARNDAVIVAVKLESEPLPVTREGNIRKDAPRKFGEDLSRWMLALGLARATGLVRLVGDRLVGFPEAAPRPLNEPIQLFSDEFERAGVQLLLRVIGNSWVGTEALLGRLRVHAREVLYSPQKSFYETMPTVPFDGDGWDQIETQLLHRILDRLHRLGVIDAWREQRRGAAGSEVVAARRAQPRIRPESGFLLTPDHEILMLSGALSHADYARLVRLAPYSDGDHLYRHRLSRQGVLADMEAGHTDVLGFLTQHSRTGVPPNIQEALQDWLRQAGRILMMTGVEVIEEEDGRLRLRDPQEPTPAIQLDYSTLPPGQFTESQGLLITDDAQLSVRAALRTVATLQSRQGQRFSYRPQLPENADPTKLIARLSPFCGGQLPAGLEIRLRAITTPPLQTVPVLSLRVPEALAAALLRDVEASQYLRRVGVVDDLTELFVDASHLSFLQARFEALGLNLLK